METSPSADRSTRPDGGPTEGQVAANSGLVIHIAKVYRGRGVPFEDLVSEGFVGLLEAIARFDPRAGARLSTYAGYWVRKRILQALAVHGQMIRIPRYARERGVGPQRRISLDAPFTADGTAPCGALLRDVTAAPPVDGLILAERRARLRATFDDLPDRERAVLASRFGLRGDRTLTLCEVGARLGLSHERVRQIEASALRTLREAIERGAQFPISVVRMRNRASATESVAYDSKLGTLQKPVAVS